MPQADTRHGIELALSGQGAAPPPMASLEAHEVINARAVVRIPDLCVPDNGQIVGRTRSQLNCCRVGRARHRSNQEVPEVLQLYLTNAVDRSRFPQYVAQHAKAVDGMSVGWGKGYAMPILTTASVCP